MKKRAALTLLIAACILAGQPSFVIAQDIVPHLSVKTYTIPLAAGTRGYIYFDVYNSGTYDVTEAESILTSSTPGISVVNSQAVFNTIPSKNHAYYNATLLVAQNVAIGVYQLSYSLSYMRLGKAVTDVIPVTIVINQAFTPMLDVSATRSSIEPGTTNNLTLVVRNISASNLSNVDVEVSTLSPYLSVLYPTKFHLDALNASSTAQFECSLLVLEAAPAGAYQLTATEYYSDPRGDRFTQISNIPLEITIPIQIVIPPLPPSTRPPIITIRSLGTPTVGPGENFTLSVEVNCTEATAYNTVVTLSLDSGGLLAPLSQTTKSLGDLQPGDRIHLTYNMILSGSATPGQLLVRETANFMDIKGQSTSTSETITVNVSEFTRLNLLSNQTFTAVQGSTLTIDSTLLLIGTSPVQFTSVEAVPPQGFQAQPNSYEYLGAVDPDSPVPFTLTLGTTNVKPGSYTVQLRVTYYNNLNAPVNRILRVPVVVTQAPVRQPSSTSDGGILGWLRALLGIQ